MSVDDARKDSSVVRLHSTDWGDKSVLTLRKHGVSEASSLIRAGRMRYFRRSHHLRSSPTHSRWMLVDKNAHTRQVDFLNVDVTLPWGWNVVRPLAGSLKGFPYELLTIPLDLQRRSVSLPWGAELPWNITGTGPFFGGMGVAPPPSMGRVSSVSPWAQYGGCHHPCVTYGPRQTWTPNVALFESM